MLLTRAYTERAAVACCCSRGRPDCAHVLQDMLLQLVRRQELVADQS